LPGRVCSGKVSRVSAPANRPRAESPPAGCWRRWCGDAAPPEPPRADPPPAPAQVAPPPAAAPGQQAEPWRVLVVEDDPSQALFAERVLNGAGMQAQVVSVTSEVMGALEQQRPDLVLMDLHMPGLDGAELTALIRQRPEFATTPIVFLTGDEDPERRFEALDL